MAILDEEEADMRNRIAAADAENRPLRHALSAHVAREQDQRRRQTQV